MILKIPIIRFLLLCLVSLPVIGHAKVDDDLVNHKVDYIISVSKVLKAGKSVSKTHFKIGIVGKGAEIKNIIKKLNVKLASQKIRNKPVSIQSYNRIKNNINVDLLVISSQTKITPNDLKGVLKSLNYILLTDSYPYGISTLNNNTINALEKEIDQSNEKLENAESKITNQIETINENDSIIEINNQIIGKNKNVIDKQHEEIHKQDSTIHTQKLLLTVAIVSLVLIGSLLFIILKINRQRKLILAEVKEKNKNILDSLNYSKNIQLAMLPNNSEFEFFFKKYFILYQPKDIVSGDFYWMEELDDKIYLSVADCTGHGVPGAMMSLICSKALTKVVKELKISEPSKILDQTVEELQNYFSKSTKTIHDGMDLSLICIDKKNDKLIFSGAHNPLYYFIGSELKILKADKQPIGSYVYRKPYTQSSLKLSSIDTIYLFSDGYPDQFGGPKNKKFSKKRFKILLTSLQNKDFSLHGNILENQINDWKGKQDQIDDISVIGIKF